MQRKSLSVNFGILGIFVLSGLASLFAQEKSASLTVYWDANTESDLAGYKVYYGTASVQYKYIVDVGNRTEYEVTDLREDQRYYFAVTAYDYAGNESGFSREVSAIPGDPGSFQPGVFLLYQNYPNPFNPRTVIPYYVPEEEHVLIQIVNLQGEVVQTLVNQEEKVGLHRVIWEGVDQFGHPVASGIYFVRFRSGGMQLAKSVIVAR